MAKTPDPRFLAVEDFAKRLSVEPARVRRWIHEGRLPHVRLGRIVRIPADALARMLSEPRK